MKAHFLLAGLLVTLPGCSIYKAATAPPPVVLESVKAGASRNTIICALGVPKSTETRPNSKVDIHEFVNGSQKATKARIVLYIAGDVFTLGLAELVFWPLELVAGQGTAGRAVVTYGMDDIAQSVLLAKADGSRWVPDADKVEADPAAPLPKATNKVNPETGAFIQ